MKTVITIGREHGSGGREIGKYIAKKLGIECYDTRFITEAAKRTGINEKIFQTYNERPVDSLLFSISMSTSAFPGFTWGTKNRSFAEQVCQAQFDLIKEFAKKPCVIVGRCADSVIDISVAKCRVFIRAEQKERILRIMQTYQLSEKDALKAITQADKERSSYYNFFTNRQWGDSRNYDLCLNVSGLSIESASEIIIDYVSKREV